MDRERVERCLEQVQAYRASGLKAKVWAHANGVSLLALQSWCTVSLIDRLVHRCEVVAIEGESYRLKEAKARAELKAAQRRTARTKAGKS
jgi:hypothetical protein